MPLPSVELYRTLERANAMAKAAATEAAPGASLGVRRLTVLGLVEELWELWGDGRVLVDGTGRNLLAASLVSADGRLSQLAGAGEVVAAFCAKVAGRLAEREAAGEPVSAAGVNGEVLALGQRYREALAERGLIEPDEAAWLLAGAVGEGSVPAASVSAQEPLDGTFGVAALLDALGCVEGFPEKNGSLEPNEGPAVDLLVASGCAAVPSLVLDDVRAQVAAGAQRVLVVAPDGAGLCEALADSLTADGVSLFMRASLPWDDTLLGRALENLSSVAAATHWREAASDFALSPVALCSRRDARAVNRKLREDRLLDAKDAEALLAEVCGGYGPLAALAALAATEGETVPASLWRAAAEVVAAAALGPVERSCETVALESLRSAVEGAKRMGVSLSLGFTVARASSVSYAAASPGDGTALVEFAGAERLDAVAPGSYDAVILADLSSRLFPLKEPLGCLNDLSEVLGLPRATSMATRQRGRFAAALGAARRRLGCVVSRRDERGDDLYPSFLLEELAAALERRGASDSLAAGRPDEAQQWRQRDRSLFNVPLPLAQRAVSAGEDDLAASVGRAFSALEGWNELPPVTRGLLETVDVLELVPTVDGRMPVLSPSAIEQYLACPYRWFVSSCLRPDAPDEGFAAPELGTFAHEVLAAFYDELAAEGIRSLSGAPLGGHLERLDRLFDEHLAAQKAERPGHRLAPATLAERSEVEALRGHLRRSLKLQAALPASFAVLAHERRIEVDDGVDFAGVRIKGRIDRIDVDEAAGRYLIVDYKGTAGGYEAGVAAEGDVELPAHIQALVYAAAFGRTEPGLACAGALYLGYRARRADKLMEGSYDPVAFDGAAVGSGKSAVEMSFPVFLERIEALVAEGLEPLLHGEIPVRPAGAEACAHCPAANCPGRLS